MGLDNPWGLLALLALPLVWYVQRRPDASTHWVPMVALWHLAPSQGLEATRRRFDALLLTRVLIVLGLGLALARPTVSVLGPERHVVLLDASASMGARDGDRSRFARAVDAAGDLIAHLPPQAEAMIVRVGATATVVQTFTRSRDTLRHAMTTLRPGESSKHLRGGVAEAAQALAGRPGLVHLFSDATDAAAVTTLAERVGLRSGDVILHRVGGPTDNLAIVGLDAAPQPQSPLDYEVFVQVANFSARAREVTVRLHRPGVPDVRRRLQVGADEMEPALFEIPATPWVSLHLEDVEDSLALDDRATLVLPRTTVRALYLGRRDRFVEAALGAYPGLELQHVRLDDPAHWPTADLAIVNGAMPLTGVPMPTLAFAAGGEGDPRRGRVVPIVDWQRRHPLLRHLDLRGILVPSGTVLAPSPGDALIQSADGVILRGTDQAGQRRVEVAFPVDQSNLGQLPTFPVLIARLIAWLTAGESIAARNVRPGQILHLAVPTPAPSSVMIRRPDGSTIAAPVRAGHVEFAGTDAVGLYHVEAPGVRIPFAVDLLDATESNLRRTLPSSFAPARAPRVPIMGRRDLARVVLAIALQLLSLEIWLLERRLRGARA